MLFEAIHLLESGLSGVVSLGQLFLEAISVLCVFLGIVKTIQLALGFAEIQYDEFLFIQLRIRFGVWLALALEFQLGADILATTITPNTDTLIRLGAIAVIRTLLNYFLTLELEHEFEFKKHQSGKDNLPAIKD